MFKVGLFSFENRQTRQLKAVRRTKAKIDSHFVQKVSCVERCTTEMYTTIYHMKQSLPSILPCLLLGSHRRCRNVLTIDWRNCFYFIHFFVARVFTNIAFNSDCKVFFACQSHALLVLNKLTTFSSISGSGRID